MIERLLQNISGITKNVIIFILILLSSPQSYISANDSSQNSKFNANGKYNLLLQKLHCPKDQASYGKYNDYGYYTGGSWCGQQAKAGYWLYVYPNWYIYKNSSVKSQNSYTTGGGKGGGIQKTKDIESIIQNDTSPLNRHKLERHPSFFGQYGGFIQKFKCKEKPTTLRKKYSHWSDLGYRNNYKTKCRNHRLKTGYVVYVQPFYYVWRKIIKKVNPLTIASAGGYYQNLIKTRSAIMSDSLYGGRVFEEGYSNLTYYPGYGKMTPGFRVLFDGKWYTWGKVYIPKNKMAKEISKASKSSQYSNLLQIVYCPYYAEWSGLLYYSRYAHSKPKEFCGGIKVGNEKPYYTSYYAPYLYIWKNYEPNAGY